MIDFWETGTEFNQIVSVEWLREHAGDLRLKLVDTRPAEQFRAGHIAGAVNSDMNLLRLSMSTDGARREFQRLADEELHRLGINTGQRVICYEDFSGASAARGVWLMDYLGLPQSAMLDGGLSAWVSAGGAISRDVQPVQQGTFEIAVQEHLLAGADDVLAAVTARNPTVTVLDTRSNLEFQIGTIPTSLHLEWLQQLAPDGRVLSKAQLQTLYAAHGLNPERDHPVVTFCGSGYRAAHSYLMLKELGFTDVKNYAPSWGEWGQRSDLPMERPVGGRD